MPLLRRALLSMIVSVSVGSFTLRAQQTVADGTVPRANLDAAESILDRPVTVRINHMSLKEAIKAVTAPVEAHVQYQVELVDAYRTPVSANFKAVPLRAALGQLLAHTNLHVVPLPDGIVGLTEIKRESARDSVTYSEITGRVTEAQSDEPIVGAVVMVYGTTPGVSPIATVQSNVNGTYLVQRLTSGMYRLVVRKVGMIVVTRSINVATGGSLVINVELNPSPTQLQALVTTGAGERERVKVGNWVTTINADSIVKATPIRNLSDLLNGRVPGMTVETSSGTVGAGSRIRIRGLSSLLTNEDPIVIVDGVRIDAAYSGTSFSPAASAVNTLPGNAAIGQGPPSGNQAALFANVPATSRLNDIDPESIESIDILRGPAASTLYGSDAANGVIVIKTKHGRPGPTRWGMTAELGQSTMQATFADSYYGWGVAYGSIPLQTSCTLLMVAARQCTQDSLTHFNPLNLRATSPFGTGHTQRVSANVSGGVPALQYFLSGSYQDNVGVLTLPSALATTTLEQLNGTPLPSWAKRPNKLKQLTATNTLSSQPNAKTDLSLTMAAGHSMQTNMPDGESGIVGSATNSLGYRDTVTNGWGSASPVGSFLTRYSDEVSRMNSSLSAHWRPWTPLSGSVVGGVDYSVRDDQALLPSELVIPGISYNSLRNRDSRTTMVKNGNVNVALNLPWRQLRFRTSVGGQYVGSSLSAVTTNAQGLASGSGTVNGAANVSTYEFSSDWITAGWYLEQSIDVNERLFLTAALRRDASSAFGQDAKAIAYPKFSLSWLVSQEPLFPHIPHLGTLRLRAAFGQAGSQPNVSERFLTFVAPPVAVSNDPIFVVNTVGNPHLLPERSQELEGGFDLGMFNDRVSLEATMYHKQTRNALVVRPLPASAGVLSQVQNIGKLSNQGYELNATLRPLASPMFDWSSTFGYSHNTNKIVTLGIASQDNGLYGRYVEGYPADGVWARAIASVDDANGNGIIEGSEIRLTDSMVYAGNGVPASTWNWHNSVALFSGRVRVGASLAYSGDMTQVNGVLLDQCSVNRCRGAVDPNASLALQALAVTAVSNSANTVWPYLERTSTVRFDEFSVSVVAPVSVLRLTRAKGATFSLLGRNLGLWTHYRGADPMVNAPGVTGSTAQDRFADFGGTPQPREWSFRINLTY